MKVKLLVVILLIPFLNSAQNHTLKGEIAGLKDMYIKISGFYGNETGVIDSVKVDGAGRFSYTFPEDAYSGMYRLRFGQNQFMDVIYNDEDIRFTSNISALIDSLVFHESSENRLYFEYLNKRNLTEYKFELLNPLLSYYPEDDTFYTDVRHKYIRLNRELQEFVHELTQENPGLYVSGLVQMDYVPAPPADLSEMEKIDYMRVHYFDGADFSDTSLLYSQVISNKILQYLSLFQNNRLGKEQLQVEFIKAVNRIMSETSENPQVYEYSMDYLLTGFESYGFDRVITYIADNIDLDQTCINSERKAELEKKVESLKKFAVGQKAPDFSATSMKGEEVTLSEIDSEYTLLVFWATWCPHCTQLLPKLETLYLPDNKGKLEIVAVSLDESLEELRNFLHEGDYNWINIADYKKWQGDVVQLYDIYATPTMFLLYNDRTILAKPMTFEEVKQVLFERNILR